MKVRRAPILVVALAYVWLAYMVTGGRCDHPTSDMYHEGPTVADVMDALEGWR